MEHEGRSTEHYARCTRSQLDLEQETHEEKAVNKLKIGAVCAVFGYGTPES